MSFASLHKAVTYLLAGLGLYALTLGGELSGIATGVVGTLYFASAFVEGPLNRRRGWIRAWNGVAVVGLLGQGFRAVLGAPLLTVGVEYAAFLQLVLLFNRRSARDHQQVAVLAILHLIASTVLSADFGFAAAFVGFVIGMPWMLALSHLRRAIEESEKSSPGTAAGTLRSSDVVGARFLAGTALVTIPIFATTLVLFLAFPRVGLGFLPLSSQSGQSTTGFGGSVELGRFGTLRTDPTVVLRFWPSGNGVVLPARFRGTSFDRYDGRTWSRSQALEFEPLRRVGTQYPIVRNRFRTDATFRIQLDPIDEPVVFLPSGTVAIAFPPEGRFGTATGRELELRPGLDLRYRGSDAPLRYSAFVSTSEVHTEDLTDSDRDRYLQLPTPSEAEAVPRLRELARALTRGAGTDMERADRIAAWLRDSGTFRYTLTLPDATDRDPLEVFLFEARAGHCEYFSTALAMLLRAVGIPTRNVTGFYGSRYNGYGGYYAVRQADAHSWVEAYLEGAWRTYDPTPPVAMPVPGGPWAEIQALFDAVRTRWARHVVGYDLRQQISLFREIGNRFRSLLGRGHGSTSRTDASADDPRRENIAFGRWILLAVAALGIAGTLVWRRRAGKRRRGTELVATTVYRALDQALAKRGVPRPAGRTPLEHAARLRDEGFEGAGAASRVTRRYIEVRFGGAVITSAELRDLHLDIAAVRRGPRRRLPDPRLG